MHVRLRSLDVRCFSQSQCSVERKRSGPATEDTNSGGPCFETWPGSQAADPISISERGPGLQKKLNACLHCTGPPPGLGTGGGPSHQSLVVSRRESSSPSTSRTSTADACSSGQCKIYGPGVKMLVRAAGSRAAFSSRPRRSATAGCSMASAISIEVQPAAMTSKGPFGDLLAIVSRSGYSSCRLREFCSASQSVAPLGFVSDVAPSRRQPGERSRRADAGTQSILAGRLALDASTSSWARLA